MPKIVAQIRQVLVENFDNQAIFDLIDFGADYLDGTTYPFGYTIHAFGRPIFDGHLHGRVLRVGILDPTAWVRLGLFFVKGADALALSLRNPFDILALLDTLQASLRHLATSYAERGLTIEAHALGQKVFSCGAGVRSNLMTDRFGPTAIHLEAIFRMLSSALQAAKEAASR
ncbi:MAG: hypothetical protein M5R36_29995 [Deltaproteobacteria bacterium]|nr:hypothetical protein [Deltaproteobacteria bacterium]